MIKNKKVPESHINSILKAELSLTILNAVNSFKSREYPKRKINEKIYLQTLSHLLNRRLNP